MTLYESFYKLISKQFSELNLEIDFKNSDILEYMVLEGGGCLNALKGMPLKCIFFGGQTSNIIFKDKSSRSKIELGFDREVNEVTKRHLIDTMRKFSNDYIEDYEHKRYNRDNTLYSFILLDKDIESAIKSSSLFIAAGNLSELELIDLLELKENISLYKVNDSTISNIVDRLTNKISQYIDSTFSKESIHMASLTGPNKFKANQVF